MNNQKENVVKCEITIAIDAMKDKILKTLTKLEKNYAQRKWGIAADTNIPEDILTVLLKQLKYEGKVKLIMIWNEDKGTPDGSGYCLS